jgi:hypothetical protein
VRPREDHQHAVLGEPCARERRFTASSREGERVTSNRNCTALSTLLTFWPPGPPARAKEKAKFGLIDHDLRVTSIVGMTFASCAAWFQIH